MFKRIKELNREHPVGSVFFRYVLLWLIICMALTAWLGNDLIETAGKKHCGKYGNYQKVCAYF